MTVDEFLNLLASMTPEQKRRVIEEIDAMKAGAPRSPDTTTADRWEDHFNRTDDVLGHLAGLVHALDALRESHPDLSDNRPSTAGIIATIAAAEAALPKLWELRHAEYGAGLALKRQQEDRA